MKGVDVGIVKQLDITENSSVEISVTGDNV
jgi:hypothetical protein